MWTLSSKAKTSILPILINCQGFMTLFWGPHKQNSKVKHSFKETPWSSFWKINFSSVQFSHSVVSNSLWAHGPEARHIPLSVEFSRQEYWSGLPFPTSEDLPDLGMEPTSFVSPALEGRFFTTEPLGKPLHIIKFTLLHLSRASTPVSLGALQKRTRLPLS